ncbi:MAG: hypothetical protein R2932_50120 [Caldilineaceae bacterium]
MELCLQAETPGYRITLAANGADYVYHTNEDGSQVRLASAPEPQLENVILEGTLNDESGCNTIQVSREQIAFGRCMTSLLRADPRSGAPGRYRGICRDLCAVQRYH